MSTQGSRRAALLAIAALAATLGAGCSKVPDTIKIGVAQPLSGPLGALGQDMLNGVTLAVQELNKSGFTVDGKTVTLEVVAQDDRADADSGKNAAQQLVESGVVAVIGNLNSGVSIAAAPIYAEKGIAQLAISTNPRFTELGLQTTLRLVANDNLQARAMGSFAATQLSTASYAVLDDGTPYGKGLADGAAKQLATEKKEVTVRQSFDDKTTDFDEVARRIQTAKVGVIVTTLNDFQVLALMQALQKINYTQLSVLGGDTIKTTDMAKATGMVTAIYATSPVLEPREFITGRQFLDRYNTAFKKAPAYGGHYSYDATYVLSAAIKQAKSADPKEVTKALRAINGYAPVTGTMTWDDKGEQRYGAVGVYSLRGSNWELRMRSDRW
ncbi:branched-chain amino acid ABC transporter substrate-binding protein [Paracidovorax valerianellae]|uniref:Branched-chain amino acid transport system substrate-binding protein n=1 Tax=Paracidovorax valerianellae TaxID=187868 RepID=A0A1G7DI95_9BURK|nr:branched-chain amino acid ABC transporter substrate-binding protein [Paracidovorax valerianellae]MDA8447490.1 branched-chain amino acid ABC transporter substrate-binding protein [Paracidovorax valerianellae]SDE51252.1 branched-chain amino acid transport system substrate-binding protein [Paracidovorax valerianellae]